MKLTTQIKNIFRKSIRRQLVLGIALVHAVLMTIFIVDLVNRQSHFLEKQNLDQTVSLARTLAANSVSWVLANDIVGLEEIVQSVRSYPGLSFAMIVTSDGRVLAHSDRRLSGQYFSDDTSKRLLTSEKILQVLYSGTALHDIAVPIYSNSAHIGWARIAVSGREMEAGLRAITFNGVIYTLIALVIGTVFAFFMARNITSGLSSLVEVATKVRGGSIEKRAVIDRDDEVGVLARDFNHMLDVLHEQTVEKEKAWSALEKHRDELEEKVALRTQDLEEARDVALKAANTKTRFLANMSHELRTPLNSIIGFTSIVKDGMAGEVNETQKKQLSIANDSAQHLLSLINEILDLRKIEEGKVELVFEEVDLDALLVNVIESLSPLANEKSLALELETMGDGLEFVTDKSKLYQVLLNIVGNSIKFTDDGGVNISYGLINEGVEICIKDSGVGIRESDLEQVFEAFSQVHDEDERQYQGTGLGLAITKQFVELLGGHIAMNSEFGVGTVTRVWLPLDISVS
ncbi:MAG: ATP-binding protein [Gammaproteobacteria bacterium]|nr:ATP-binding protein [Gammaproteobacteria bacterium]